MKFNLIIIFVFLFQISHSQKTDSLILNPLAEKFRAHLRSDPDSAMYYAKKLKTESIRLKNQKGEALANNFFGVCKIYSGDYDTALICLNRSLEIRSKIENSTKAICDLYSNIGVCYDYKGDFPSALRSYLKSLKIAEETNDIQVIAKISNNIGAIYYQQRKYKEALEYFLRTFKIREELKETGGLATACLNLCNCYGNLKMSDKEEEYLNKCVQYAKLSGDTSIMAESYSLMASNFFHRNKAKEAIEYYEAAIKCFKSMNGLSGMSDVYYQLGYVFLRNKEYHKAHQSMLNSYSLAKQIDYLAGVSYAASGLAVTSAYLNKPDSAESYITIYRDVYDTLYSRNNAQMVAEMQTKYGSEKKEQENKLLTAKNLLAEENAKTQRNIIWFTLIAFVLVLITAVVSYRGYKTKKTANQKLSQLNSELVSSKTKIELQRDLIEVKQKEILDSIHYAKRIQNSLLPSEKYIEKRLDDLIDKKKG